MGYHIGLISSPSDSSALFRSGRRKTKEGSASTRIGNSCHRSKSGIAKAFAAIACASILGFQTTAAEVPDRETVFIAEPGEQDDLEKLFPDGPPKELFGEPDPDVLESLDKLADDKLEDLLNIYERTGNLTMGQAVAAEMLKRDPKNPDALRARDELRIEVRTIDYNSKVAAALLAGEEIKDFDAVAAEAGDMNQRGNYARAERLLTALRSRYFQDKPFPFAKDLAYTYHGQGQFSRAAALFQSVLDDPASDAESKAEARAGLRDVEVGRMLVAGDAAIKASNGTRALELANRLLKIDPADPDHKVLKSRALSVLGRHDDAIGILTAMRGRSTGHFPQLRELAFAYFEAGMIDESEAAFIELLKTPGYSEEERRDARKSLADYRRDRLLKNGELALKSRDIRSARTIADELLEAEPNHPDVLMFVAEIMMATHHHGDAKNLLLSLKERDFRDVPFPAQGTLAYSHFQTGDVLGARSAFEELLAQPTAYTPAEAVDAQTQWRDLDFFIRPSITTEFTFVDESEGTGLHIESHYRTALENQLRFYVETETDILRLSSESPVGELSGERYAARAGVERLFEGGYFARGYVGASYSDINDGELLAGIGIGKYPNYGVGWSLLANYNAPSRKGLSLEYLDGREHNIEFNITVPINERLQFEGQLAAEQVDIYGEKVGYGYGIEAILDYTLIKELPGRPRVGLSYVGIYHKFESDQPDSALSRQLGFADPLLARDLVNDLIDPYDHRHGAKITISKRLPRDLEIYAAAGFFYAFDDDAFQYEITGGFHKWVSDNIKLYAEGYYDSSGQGASSGEAVVGVQAGVSIKF